MLRRLLVASAVLAAAMTPSSADAGPNPCAEMQAYRVAAGLPSRFDAIGFRESRCRNTAVNRRSATSGWWQIHPVLWRDRSGRRIAAQCGAPTLASVRGHSAAAKRRQACVAAGLYHLNGLRPWAL